MTMDENKNFLVNKYRDIVENEDGSYRLEPIYKFDENGELKFTGHKANKDNELCKRCWRCIYHEEYDYRKICSLRKKIENIPRDIIVYSSCIASCDAENVVEPLCIIRSMDEMITYIERAECMFKCPDDYDEYFGMKRKFNETKGEYVETVREYYKCGGKFRKIPDRFPVVVFFDLAMSGVDVFDHCGLEWIYIGGEKCT